MVRPLTSIIVNVCNGERYIAECLESILTLAGGFPVQVIVLDDASADGTSQILNRYRQAGIQIVRLEKNIGAAAAINHAFALVQGELVARIDYDDRYHPNFLIESIAALERHPDAAFACASAAMIGPGGAPAGAAGPSDYGEMPGCRDRFQSMLTRHFVTAPTILGRASHWRRAIPIPKGMDFCDWYMNLTMAERAPVAVIDATTADYRVHPLGMHTTKVNSGMGERVTFQVLNRFLLESPRSAEIAAQANHILALHRVDWGNKYFGAGMNDDAMRCYRMALAHEPLLALTGGFAHRLAGLLMGRNIYEQIKRLLARSAPVSTERRSRDLLS